MVGVREDEDEALVVDDIDDPVRVATDSLAAYHRLACPTWERTCSLGPCCDALSGLDGPVDESQTSVRFVFLVPGDRSVELLGCFGVLLLLIGHARATIAARRRA